MPNAVIIAQEVEVHMERVSEVRKSKIANALSEADRPIHKIEKLKKGNSSPLYDGKSLRQRSKDTAKVRTARYNKLLAKLVS